MLDKSQKFIFTDAVFLAFLSIWGYSLAFAYQAGFLSNFDIQWAFIDISLVGILQSLFGLLIAGLLIILCSEITILILVPRKHKIVKSLFFALLLSLFLSFPIGTLINFKSSILLNIFVVLIVSIVAYTAVFLIYFFIFESGKTWNVFVLTSFFNKFKPKLTLNILVVMSLLLVSPFWAYSFGKLVSFRKTHFVSFNTPEYVYVIVHKWENQFFTLTPSDNGCDLRLFPIEKVSNNNLVLSDMYLENGINTFCYPDKN